jgi:GNAT superfamily N-acetyltransferase
MRLYELFEQQQLDEIERLNKTDYTGGKESLYDKKAKVVRKLPGGSGFTYAVEKETGRRSQQYYTIKIFDPNGEEATTPPKKQSWEMNSEYQRRLKRWEQLQGTGPGQLVAQLTLHNPHGDFPLKNALQVGAITVDEDYRGAGLAKALYGIVLTIMKRPLVAGDSQTPGGRRNWVSLSQIPGVQMKGYFALDAGAFTTEPDNDAYARAGNKKVNDRIDVIMGQLGGQYMGQQGRFGNHYFAFDVKPNTTGTELESYIKTKLSTVYGSNYETTETGLFAVWAP